MLRYLVVANRTLAGEHLAGRIRYLLAQNPCRFHVVVPATPSQQQVSWTEVEAMTGAQERLDKALAFLREVGAEAEGEIGDADPVKAVHAALARVPCDEIIVSTLPEGRSAWLRRDLPSRIQRTFGLPVTHLAADD